MPRTLEDLELVPLDQPCNLGSFEDSHAHLDSENPGCRFQCVGIVLSLPHSMDTTSRLVWQSDQVCKPLFAWWVYTERTSRRPRAATSDRAGPVTWAVVAEQKPIALRLLGSKSDFFYTVTLPVTLWFPATAVLGS